MHNRHATCRGRLLPPRAGAIVPLCLLLAACAVGPDFETPAAPDVTEFVTKRSPSGAATQTREQQIIQGFDIPARWWELFGSNSLNELIQLGIKQNADLEAAGAAVRVAQANALAQRGSLFPVIGGNFTPTRQRIPNQSLTSNVVSGADIYNLHTAQVTVTFVPDVFGGTRRQVEAADAQVEYQTFQREGVYLALASNIALAAIREASLREQIAVTRRLIQIQNELLGVLRRQLDRGQIALPDVVAQETAVAQVGLLLPSLEKDLDQQRHLLAFLTGRFPSDEIEEKFSLRSFRKMRAIPTTLPANLVRQRPDIRAVEATLRAANAQIGVALANRLPQISLSANAGSTAIAIGQLFTPGAAMWTLAGSVSQTVFDAGTLENKQRAAEETFNQVTAQYRGVVLTAFQNVADTLRALQADTRAINAAVTAERSASRNIDLVRKQVERGQVSVPNLINAQQAYLQASLARVQAVASRLSNTVALFQALGGGWWNRTESDEVAEYEAEENPL